MMRSSASYEESREYIPCSVCTSRFPTGSAFSPQDFGKLGRGFKPVVRMMRSSVGCCSPWRSSGAERTVFVLSRKRQSVPQERCAAAHPTKKEWNLFSATRPQDFCKLSRGFNPAVGMMRSSASYELQRARVLSEAKDLIRDPAVPSLFNCQLLTTPPAAHPTKKEGRARGCRRGYAGIRPDLHW
jgi:hypothetical protein